MDEAEHRFASPDELRAALSPLTQGLAEPEVHAIEVRLAVAEATCARRTALAAAAAELDRFYGDQVREQYKLQINTERRLQLAALPRAREVIDVDP